MSTDISHGSRVCPSCGRENTPTAAHCWLCFTPLGGAIQTTTAPAPGEQPLSVQPRRQPTSLLEESDRALIAGCALAMLLAIIGGFVTFFLVCTAAFSGPMH